MSALLGIALAADGFLFNQFHFDKSQGVTDCIVANRKWGVLRLITGAANINLYATQAKQAYDRLIAADPELNIEYEVWITNNAGAGQPAQLVADAVKWIEDNDAMRTRIWVFVAGNSETNPFGCSGGYMGCTDAQRTANRTPIRSAIDELETNLHVSAAISTSPHYWFEMVNDDGSFSEQDLLYHMWGTKGDPATWPAAFTASWPTNDNYRRWWNDATTNQINDGACSNTPYYQIYAANDPPRAQSPFCREEGELKDECAPTMTFPPGTNVAGLAHCYGLEAADIAGANNVNEDHWWKATTDISMPCGHGGTDDDDVPRQAAPFDLFDGIWSETEIILLIVGASLCALGAIFAFTSIYIKKENDRAYEESLSMAIKSGAVSVRTDRKSGITYLSGVTAAPAASYKSGFTAVKSSGARTSGGVSRALSRGSRGSNGSASKLSSPSAASRISGNTAPVASPYTSGFTGVKSSGSRGSRGSKASNSRRKSTRSSKGSKARSNRGSSVSSKGSKGRSSVGSKSKTRGRTSSKSSTGSRTRASSKSSTGSRTRASSKSSTGSRGSGNNHYYTKDTVPMA